jgi:hypothetical protein
MFMYMNKTTGKRGKTALNKTHRNCRSWKLDAEKRESGGVEQIPH